MPTLNIKDPEVYRLASELAGKRGISMTAAVRDALSEGLARKEVEFQERLAILEDISRRGATLDVEVLTDDDLHDERGLPR